ncbi:MAG TPA: hypothetical protein VLY83_00630 [Methanoregula sp.]|nr:hypothetical protein [Methanoregula sp.]
MRWVATYKGGSHLNRADGLFSIGRIRKLGYRPGSSGNWRYLGIVLEPEGYVIYETNLDIEERPSDPAALRVWRAKYLELLRRVMLDVITELDKEGAGAEIVDLMARFGFRET